MAEAEDKNMIDPTPKADCTSEAKQPPSFWKNTWKSFRQNKLALLSLYVVGILIVIAVLADFLAYGKPYYARLEGKTYYPIFYDYGAKLGLYKWEPWLIHAEWSKLNLESEFWPPVRYSPQYIDIFNGQSKGPFEDQITQNWKQRHFLGTDQLGRDVLSGLIHGTRISLTVGLVAVGIAAMIGILLGAFAGFYGDSQLRVSRANLIFTALGVFFGYFYGIFIRSQVMGEAISESIGLFLLHFMVSMLIFFGFIVVFNLLAWPLRKIPFLNKKVPVWVDIAISRLIEIVVSIPQLLIIISIGAIADPSLYLVMVVIGLTSWTGIARLTRGEMLKARNLEYMQAAKALGFNEFRSIMRHALPNVLAPVFVTIAFGISSAILLESTLSFLGIGVPPDTVTWGSILKEARGDTSAWWLAVFPGIAIFVTVTIFNLLGEGLRDALDPRLKKKR